MNVCIWFWKIIKNNQIKSLNTSAKKELEETPFVDIYYNADDAVKDIKSKARLLVGGFGNYNNPFNKSPYEF